MSARSRAARREAEPYAVPREDRARFYARQGLLGLGLIATLLIGLRASAILGGVVANPFIAGRPYINLVILGTLLLYGSLVVLTMFRVGDRGWPFLGLTVSLFVIIASFEDAIVQWFTIQQGILSVGGRVNPIQITAFLASFGFLVMMHQTQIAYRIRGMLAVRGVDERELQRVPELAHKVSKQVVLPVFGSLAAISLGLFIGERVLFLSDVDLGIQGLGILGGLVIVLMLSVFLYRELRRGPFGALGKK